MAEISPPQLRRLNPSRPLGVSDRPALFMPHYGEFGWFVMNHIRTVHHWEAPEKIVCCRPGDEVYFPSAARFEYDWKNFVDDFDKTGIAWDVGCPSGDEYNRMNRELAARLIHKHGEVDVVQRWEQLPWRLMNSTFDLVPSVRYEGLDVDVAISARRRDFGTDRNWSGWPAVVRGLRDYGLRVGIIGTPGSSYDCDADVKCWDYESLGDAVVGMLQRCKLFVGGDTGPAHLAAFLQTPMLCLRFGTPEAQWMMCMANTTRSFCQCLLMDLPHSAYQSWRDLGPVLSSREKAPWIVRYVRETLDKVTECA